MFNNDDPCIFNMKLPLIATQLVEITGAWSFITDKKGSSNKRTLNAYYMQFYNQTSTVLT